MIILKVEQDVCSQCKVLGALLFPIPEVAERIETVNLDHMEDNEFWTREQFVEGFDIMATPTMIFLDDQHNELHRFTGVMGLTPEMITNKVEELDS